MQSPPKRESIGGHQNGSAPRPSAQPKDTRNSATLQEDFDELTSLLPTQCLRAGNHEESRKASVLRHFRLQLCENTALTLVPMLVQQY